VYYVLKTSIEKLLYIRRAIKGGGISPPEIFKTLHSNFDICRNFQIIKLKYCILIIFKKSYSNFSLSYWLITVSPRKIYLETGDLIENGI